MGEEGAESEGGGEGAEKYLLGINSKLGSLGSHAVNPFQPYAAGLLQACHLCRSQPNTAVVQGWGERCGGAEPQDKVFLSPETPPAPQAGGEEQREGDSGKENLGPGWELRLHGPATILQVFPGWIPQFLAFIVIHALCSIFPSGVRNPHVYFSAEERPWLLLRPREAAPVWGRSGERMTNRCYGVRCPSNAGQTCHTAVCLRQMKADRLFPNYLIYMSGPGGPGSGTLDLLAAVPGEGRIQDAGSSEEGREDPSQRGNLSVGCEGCRAPVLPPNAFPKAAGSHQGWHIPACHRGERGFIPRPMTRGTARPSPGTHNPHQHHSQEWGLGFFFLLQFFSPPFSLSPSGLFLSFAGAQEFS